MIASRPLRTPRSLLAPGVGPRWAALGALSLLLWSNRSAAQTTEAEKPPPNVLLLVDSSGSMEFKTDGTFPTCTPGSSTQSEKSRWIELLEVLTGQFEEYSCWGQSRDTAKFSEEFALGASAPYDFGYVNPYHRPLSHMCAPGPGQLPSSPYAWPAVPMSTFPLVGSVGSFELNRSSYNACTDDFRQGNGLLDTYGQLIRFGLMTFDARTSGGTGVEGGAADYATGMDGNWSYYVGSPTMGRPEGCDEDTPQEVGARNAAAPPWEGRMVAFGPQNAGVSRERNEWIQKVLLSTRPYGATPIAGQLDDALKFLYEDGTDDPLNPSEAFGPMGDRNWQATNCRKTILILLTDGEPNLDLRPYCQGPTEGTDNCPYERPHTIVEKLRAATGAPDSDMKVETYVVGFAMGSVRPSGATEEITCAELTGPQCSDPNNNVIDEERSKKIQACCTLNEIAAAGGNDDDGAPRKAYFASNSTELQSIFTEILDGVLQVATRTMPVFSGAGGDSASRGYKFFSAFNPKPDPTSPQLWEGVLERRRYVCGDNLVARLEKTDATAGDDFAANLRAGSGLERRFYTVIAEDDASQKTIRPFVASGADGLGSAGGEQVVANGPAAVAGIIPPAAMSSTAQTCDTACRNQVIRHLVGLQDLGDPSRCSGGTCRLLGGIYHSVPTVVPGRPSELLRDETYAGFVAEMATLARPSAIYTSTVDGFLHAFNLAPFPNTSGGLVDEEQKNELWAFIPPAVLPLLRDQYPANNSFLLDGVPIIKDVVATKSDADPPVVTAYERVADQALAGEGAWRTVLVQGFGSESPVGGGYFAVDITEPGRTGGQQPTFRWQLTRSDDDKPLFGRGGTPLITTLFINVDNSGSREVPVAVLPGGDADPDAAATTALTDAALVMDTEQSGFKTAREGRSYTSDEARLARSLTIVRLDTGEVIRSFRAEAGPFATDVVQAVDLDAPITGQPKAFPETTGAVADRIYVGDRDGRLWRVDVSSADPAQWRMKRMYDAFYDGTASSSQPILLPPVLSVDELGDVTLAFATGSQKSDDSRNRVVSLTEHLNEAGTDFVAHVNWFQTLDAGYQVMGNMVLFNSALYYAASRQPATSGVACDFGSSVVYGAHYTRSADFLEATANGEEPSPRSGPAPVPKRHVDGEPESSVVLATPAGLVFGVSLEAEPTCAAAAEDVTGNDSFGYGQVSMSTEVKPGGYFLSYSASGNNTPDSERGVLEVREALETPRLPVTFQSWAVVYE